MIKIKRIYDKASEEDGFRILVDRLWPRGMSKDKAKVDLWLKGSLRAMTCGSGSLMTRRNGEFKKRYEKELKDKQELLRIIKQSR